MGDFSKYEADFPEKSSEWWRARATRVPRKVKTEYAEFLQQLELFSNDSNAYYGLESAVAKLQSAIKKEIVWDLKIRNKHLVHFDAPSLMTRYPNLLDALTNLLENNKPADYVPLPYRDW